MKEKEIKKLKPIVKNFYRKTITAVKSTAILTLIAGSIFTGTNVVREVRESINGQNQIIEADFGPFGSYVIYNRDTRTAIQIYDDAIKTALNVEGLEEVYNNSQNMTIEQKKAFLTKFAKEVGESAGVNIKEVVFVDREDMNGAKGIYFGYNKGIIHYTQNKIHISNEILQTSSMEGALKTVFHEVGAHAIESINIQTNKNVINLNPSVHNGRFTYAEEVYYSNFHEFTAHLLDTKFAIELEKQFGTSDIDYNYYVTYSSMNDILNEIVDNDMQFNNRTKDYYKELKVEDVIYIGFKNNYENKSAEFNVDVFKNSYSYEIINYAIDSSVLKMNFSDYSTGYGQYKSWDLLEESTKLQDYIQSFESGSYSELVTGIDDYGMTEEDYRNFAEQTLARQMAKVISIVRYDAKSYAKDDVQEAYSLIADNLDLIKTSSIDYYRLDKTDNINLLTSAASSNMASKTLKNTNIKLNDELER